MNKLPKLLDWTKLSSLSLGMIKQASTENPVIQTKEHKVTDAFGKEHSPKDGFSGPHLDAKGMASYTKDGRTWCPYHNAFLDEVNNDEPMADKIAKIAKSSLGYIRKMQSNPDMLRNFCEHYGYDGEPLGCLRAAFSSSDALLRKFAMLAAFEAEERIIIKKAQFDGKMPSIISDDDKIPQIQSKMQNFIMMSAGKVEEKTPLSIMDQMILDAEKSSDKMLQQVLTDYTYGSDEGGGEKSRALVDAEYATEAMSEDQVSQLASSLAAVLAEEFGRLRYVLKANPKVEGAQFPGEFATPSFGKEGILPKNHGFSPEVVATSSSNDAVKHASKNIATAPVDIAMWKKCVSWSARHGETCPSAHVKSAAAKRYIKLGGKYRKLDSSEK